MYKRFLVAAGTVACLCGALALTPPVPSADGGTAWAREAPRNGGHHTEGRVAAAVDGDTVFVELDGVSTRVRLAQIDAPEKAQPFGRRAERSLRELIGQRMVSMTWREVDRYGRPIVQMLAGGQDVNAEQVRRGYAWVFRRYSHDATLHALEEQARAAKRGLWADAHPVEPWEWRKKARDIAE
jgi:endonuclease YncB( thermonuclease family)